MTDEEFQGMIDKVVGTVVHEPELVKLGGTGKVFSFGTMDGDVNWVIDTSGDTAYSVGLPEKYDVRATMTKGDWSLTLQGKLSATQAMLRKKLKVEGSVMTLMSLPVDALLRTYKAQMEGQSA